ncbi:hypothetical protein OWV82_006824 [Melia azedarach]|uniref:Uncharacterized protein n=1 Tax=Melia azedarach TaxID=155640 RepID=A0ACC1YJ38_MELAZ|nr:hypothetical protein OWV82_006824 [Melia azedarach]
MNPLFPQRLSINQPASSSDHIVEIPAAGDDPTTQQSRGDGSPSTALHVAVRQDDRQQRYLQNQRRDEERPPSNPAQADPQASGQNQRRDEDRPPSNPAQADPQASGQNQRRDEERPPFNPTRLDDETLIMITVQTASVLGTFSVNRSSLPHNSQILWFVSLVCILLAFIMVLYRKFPYFGRGMVAQTIRGLASIFTAFAFITSVTMHLDDNSNLLVTAVCLVAAVVALIPTFKD